MKTSKEREREGGMDSSFKAKWPEASPSVPNADGQLRFTSGLNQFSPLAPVVCARTGSDYAKIRSRQ